MVDQIGNLRACMADPKITHLFCTPESITPFLDKCKAAGLLSHIGMIVYDECHLAEEWGSTFRALCAKIGDIRKEYLPNIPLMALTATATAETIEKLESILRLGKMGPPLKVVRGPQNRPELFFASRMMVNEQTDLVEPALQWMLTGQNKGILGIYKYSPQEVEQFRRLLLSEMDKIPELKGKDHLVGVIHANLSAEQRDAVLARAKQGIIRILIGTVCMGLGLNIPEIRSVFCYGMATMAELQQKGGRGGRDHLPAHVLWFYEPSALWSRHLFKADGERDQVNPHELRVVSELLSTEGCKREFLLRFFSTPQAERSEPGVRILPPSAVPPTEPPSSAASSGASSAAAAMTTSSLSAPSLAPDFSLPAPSLPLPELITSSACTLVECSARTQPVHELLHGVSVYRFDCGPFTVLARRSDTGALFPVQTMRLGVQFPCFPRPSLPRLQAAYQLYSCQAPPFEACHESHSALSLARLTRISQSVLTAPTSAFASSSSSSPTSSSPSAPLCVSPWSRIPGPLFASSSHDASSLITVLQALPRGPQVVLLRPIASNASADRLFQVKYSTVTVEHDGQTWSVKRHGFVQSQSDGTVLRVIDVVSVAPKSGSKTEHVEYRTVCLPSVPPSTSSSSSSSSSAAAATTTAALPSLTAMGLPERADKHRAKCEQVAISALPLVMLARCGQCDSAVTRTHPFEANQQLCCSSCDFPVVAMTGSFPLLVMLAIAQVAEAAGTRGITVSALCHAVKDSAVLKQSGVVWYVKTLNALLGAQRVGGGSLTLEIICEFVQLMYDGGMLQADLDLQRAQSKNLKPTPKTNQPRVSVHSEVCVYAPTAFLAAPSSSSSSSSSVGAAAQQQDLRPSSFLADLIAHHSAYTLVACSSSLLYALLRMRKQPARLVGAAKDKDFGFGHSDDQAAAMSAEQADVSGMGGGDDDEDEDDADADDDVGAAVHGATGVQSAGEQGDEEDDLEPAAATLSLQGLRRQAAIGKFAAIIAKAQAHFSSSMDVALGG